MKKLNLPDANLVISKKEGRIFVFDIIRKKEVVLTEEEWVRQHILYLLINGLNYPKGLIRVESGHSLNSLQKRTDLIVYNNNGLPALLVECKAPSVKIDHKTASQILIYNKTVNAKYLLLTNGMHNFCYRKLEDSDNYEPMNSIPNYKEL